MKKLKLAVAMVAAIAAIAGCGAEVQNRSEAEAQNRSGTPWTDASVTLNAEQLQAARRLNDYVRRTDNPPRALGVDLNDVNWRHSTDWSYPMGNMTAPGFRNLVSGRYVITYYDWDDWKGMEISYYGPGGDFARCGLKEEGSTIRSNQSNQNTWYVRPNYFGLSADAKRDRGFSWPKVYDPRTGSLFNYFHNENVTGWRTGEGFVQAEFPAFVADFCPDFPRVANVNTAQTEADYHHARNAAQVIRTNEGVVFVVDPQAPLTAGMYFNQFPPAQ